MSFNLVTILRETARERPDQTCLVEEDATTLTYRELEARVAARAAQLRASGLRPGDRVVLQLPNGVAFVERYFALLHAGLVAVPVNPLLTPREVEHVMSNSGAALLITDADDAPASPPIVPIEPHLTAPQDTATIIYTGGTTGHPKGAELSHFQQYMNSTVGSEIGDLGPDSVALTALPLFHVFGLSVLNGVVRRGARLVVHSRFDARTVVDALHAHAATHFYGVPTMVTTMVAPLAEGPPPALLYVFCGGAALPTEVIRRFEAAAPGVVILEGYGLSETTSTTTMNVSREERRIGSTGRPIWGIEVAVVGDDGPLPAGAEHVGEILVRGHNVTRGYFGNPDATAAAIRDGWLHTGDLGYLDADGYLFVVDRKKDLIIRGGYNVYPREVEEVLHEHPDVAEAAVVGVPDERLGEEILACVSLVDGAEFDAEQLIDFCRSRLARYKHPRQVLFLDALPKGSTGKILKSELRAAAAAR